MSIWVTGDCHGDFQRFTPEEFPQQKEMSRDDCIIITGDCGGVWAGEQTDSYKLDWLEDKPFTSSAHALYPPPRRKRRQADFATSRWPEEMPSEAEYAEAKSNLERAGWCVDCVLTHCAPTSIAQTMNRHYQPDELTDFLQMVKRRCKFSRWFCGHYHVNQVINERFVIQWEQISKVE